MVAINQNNLLSLLGAISTVFVGIGNTQQAEAIQDLMAAYRAGKNIDNHMQLVADALNSGLPIDWPELRNRIATNSSLIAQG